MTLSRQIINSRIHHEQHLNNRLRSEDPCCPICHPIEGEIPDSFTQIWNFATRNLIPSAHRYNQNTLNAILIAEDLRTRLQTDQRVTSETREILLSYQQIFETLIYRTSPNYPADSLAYFTLAVLLVTEGQLHNITLPQRDSILSGRNPASLRHPNFRLIRILQTAWSENLTNRRDENAPILPIERFRTPSPERADTSFASLSEYQTSEQQLFGADFSRAPSQSTIYLGSRPPTEPALTEPEILSEQESQITTGISRLHTPTSQRSSFFIAENLEESEEELTNVDWNELFQQTIRQERLATPPSPFEPASTLFTGPQTPFPPESPIRGRSPVRRPLPNFNRTPPTQARSLTPVRPRRRQHSHQRTPLNQSLPHTQQQ